MNNATKKLTAPAHRIAREALFSGSVLLSHKYDAKFLGELIRAGFHVRAVLPRDTKIANMETMRAKGFEEYTVRAPAGFHLPIW